MKDRKFGIEIECGFKKGSYSAYSQACELIQKAGRDGEIQRYWGEHMGSDGTLLEARSPILSGREGFAEVRRVMTLLKDNGGYVTSRDGLHIHHDAPEYVDDVDATLRLVQSWVANQTLIHKFVAPARRNHHACPRWISLGHEPSVEELERYKKDHAEKKEGDFKDGYWGRRDLNIASLKEHGTIEIRLHQGTLDPVRAEAWIRFGQALLNKIIAMKNPISQAESREELLQRIRAPKFTQENLKVYR